MSSSTSATRAAAKSGPTYPATAADLPPLPASAVHDDLDTPALFAGQLAKDWDVLVHDHDLHARTSFPAASLAHPDAQQATRRPSLASLNVDSARLVPAAPPKSPTSTSPLVSPALRPTLMPHGPTSTPVGALREVARASAHVLAPAVAGPVVCADCGSTKSHPTELVVPPASAPAPVSPPLIATAAAAVVDKCVACIEAVAHGVQREAASKRPMVAFRH
ncbi:hypothetical protein GGF32_005804 [Allomyces javanicus]|nr:hypothetical protein GGF32_005804 [Allomyces javanicus]